METLYKQLNDFIWKHPFIKGCIHFISRFCPYMIIIFYSLFLLKIYIEWQSQLFYFIRHPLYSVLVVLIIKLLINRQRPMQKYNIKPIDDTKKTNYSFPSIQVAFAVSVALTVIKYGPNMGLLLSTLAIAITITRFLSGIHYLSDVVISVFIAYIINFLFK